MSAATSNDERDEALCCQICLEYYLDPYTCVPCGHSFCGRCLHRWLDGSRRCALCSVQLSHAVRSYALKAATEAIKGPSTEVASQ